MSAEQNDYTPKVGDRVRITYEGVVSGAGATGRVQLDGNNLIHHPHEWASVEKIAPPLPTKPGAVVFPYDRTRHEAYFRREEGNIWVSSYGERIPEGEVRDRFTEGTHYVAFEGVET